jgi:hypothetical protein
MLFDQLNRSNQPEHPAGHSMLQVGHVRPDDKNAITVLWADEPNKM